LIAASKTWVRDNGRKRKEELVPILNRGNAL
jgi:hypothetical protein